MTDRPAAGQDRLFIHGDVLPVETVAGLVHPHQLGVQDWTCYDCLIDMRSADEFAIDHIPGAINRVDVDSSSLAQVSSNLDRDERDGGAVRVLLYSGGSNATVMRLAASLRSDGVRVDVLAGGFANYRRWVDAGLDILARVLRFRMLVGLPLASIDRAMAELARQGCQAVPVDDEPVRDRFTSKLLERLRHLDAGEPVWVPDCCLERVPAGMFAALAAAPTFDLRSALDASESVESAVRRWLPA